MRLYAWNCTAKICRFDGSYSVVAQAGVVCAEDEENAMIHAEKRGVELMPNKEGYFDHAFSIFVIPDELIRKAGYISAS